MNKLIYAGIGARQTPPEMIDVMNRASYDLANMGWSLRSGHALGADYAFEQYAKSGEIHLPWAAYNSDLARNANLEYLIPEFNPDLTSIAAAHHPNWENLTRTVRYFMIRNVSIILGAQFPDTSSYARMVICWSPQGKIKGGTGHAIRVAQGFDIPVYNLFFEEHQQKLVAFVQDVDSDRGS